jgi:zinc protease
MLMGILATVSGTPLAAQFPTEPPEPAPLRPVQLPPFAEARLDNGLQLLLIEDHDVPVVSVSLTFPAGSVFDPRGKEGLASLIGELLVRGTTSRSAEEIAQEIEGVGASLNAGASDDFLTVSTTVLTEHVPVAFELVGDVVRNSTFPADEVELARTRFQSNIRAQEAQPQFLAAKFLLAELYGEHPYGRTATSAAIGAVTRDDILAFAARHLRPGGALLVVAGDIDLERLRSLARDHLGEWTGAAPAVTHPPVPTTDPTDILLVNRPGSVQSQIAIGTLTMRPGDPDYYSITVANKLMGQGFDSRLFLIVREEKGWTYDISTSHTRPVGIGRFEVSTPVRTAVTDSVIREILHQLERVRTEPVSPEELTGAKGFLAGSFPLRIETPQQVAGQVRQLRLLGLSDDYLRNYRDRVAAVSSSNVQDVMRRRVNPDSLVIVVVGDGAAIYETLAGIGPVRVIDIEGNTMAAEDLTAPAAAVEFDAGAIAFTRDSFAVMVQGNPFGYVVRQVARATDGGGRDVYQYNAQLSLPGFASQETSLSVDQQTWRPLRLIQSGQQQGQTLSIDVTYGAEGQVTGSVHAPLADGVRNEQVDTTLDPNVIDDNMIAAFAGALPLAAGQRLSVSVYDAAQGEVQQITVAVSDGGSVTVPAGTFDTFKLDLTGAAAPLEYWVSKTAPRKLVRWSIVGQPINFELASSTEGP